MPDMSAPPPNPYSSMAGMPGAMPPKKDDKTEELMKGMHGVFKALGKMDEMAGAGNSKEIAAAKKSLKDFVANVLKGDPSTLEDDKKDDSATPPPPADSNAPPPDGATPPSGAPPAA